MSYLGNNPNTAPSIVVSEYIATAGQTTFSASYYEYVQVFLNGMLLSDSDYTANDGSTVVLAVGANAGDVILINGYEVGLQGIKGDTGAQGPKGDKGDTGDTGATGADGAVMSVAGRTGDVVLAKADVGLNNVNNTADANKPISTSTQTALNAKANLSSNTYTAPQRTNTSASSNAIDFRIANNFTINATAANITVTSLLGCIGQSGVIVIESAQNVTGWGAEFNFKTVPTSMSGMEVFSYFVQTETVIRIGRVS